MYVTTNREFVRVTWHVAASDFALPNVATKALSKHLTLVAPKMIQNPVFQLTVCFLYQGPRSEIAPPKSTSSSRQHPVPPVPQPCGSAEISKLDMWPSKPVSSPFSWEVGVTTAEKMPPIANGSLDDFDGR